MSKRKYFNYYKWLLVVVTVIMGISVKQVFAEENQMTLNWRDYIPFVNYNNYDYVGDGAVKPSEGIIMEYAPDSRGVFQISVLTQDGVSAYVYQIRDTGLYELACFPQYSEVRDLRYSPMATDHSECLILPSKIEVGNQYVTGYDQSISREISAIYTELIIDDHVYYDVVQVKESVPHGQTLYYYYAPNFGLILVETLDASGIPVSVQQLISTQGSIR